MPFSISRETVSIVKSMIQSECFACLHGLLAFELHENTSTSSLFSGEICTVLDDDTYSEMTLL